MEVVAPEDIPVTFEGVLPLMIALRLGNLAKNHVLMDTSSDRYRWSRLDNRRAEGIRHLPSHTSASVRTLFLTSLRTVRCPVIRPSWLRKDHASEGSGA
jgi:hypothetical protein